MKVFAIDGSKNFFKIGESESDALWFTKTDTVKNVMDTLNIGDELTFTWEPVGKKKHLTSIDITKKAQYEYKANHKFRTPEDLRKDETMRSTCLAISAMPGQFTDISSLGKAIYSLYDVLYAKVR